MIDKNKKPILLFHGRCSDGWGSKYAFWKRFGNEIEYKAILHNPQKYYGIPEEDLVSRKIYMADICFPRKDLECLSQISDVTVIDHHLTAKEECEDLSFCHFDMNHSGSILSWNYCFPNLKAPFLLQCIEDRDIWKWQIPNSEEYLAAIDSYPQTLESWSKMEADLESEVTREKYLTEGSAIRRYSHSLMEKISSDMYISKVKGYDVPLINISFFKSEILSKLSEAHPFAIGYHFDGKKYICSLRSNKNNPNAINVAELAAKISPGAGGHFHASGMQLKSLDELR